VPIGAISHLNVAQLNDPSRISHRSRTEKLTMAVSFKQFRLLLAFCLALSTRNLAVAQDQPAKEAQAKRIQSLIQQLTEIEDPYLGLSPTMTGTGFAPVPSSERMRNGILMNHGLKTPEVFAKLVELGPVALPYLLQSLDDKTPTKLKIEHSGFFGFLAYGTRPSIRWVAGEVEFVQNLIQSNMEADIAKYIDLPPEFIAKAKNPRATLRELGTEMLPRTHQEFNPRNPAETKILEQIRSSIKVSDEGDQEIRVVFGYQGLKEYTVTVGDLCYVIIGQITNRSYFAIQYQPTACLYM
jgi:hypothetical protein